MVCPLLAFHHRNVAVAIGLAVLLLPACTQWKGEAPCAGCGGDFIYYSIEYVAPLSTVEHEPREDQYHSNVHVHRDSTGTTTYRDNLLTATLEFDGTRLDLSVFNRTANRITVRLNDSRFIDSKENAWSLHLAYEKRGGLDESPSPLRIPAGDSSSVTLLSAAAQRTSDTEPPFTPASITVSPNEVVPPIDAFESGTVDSVQKNIIRQSETVQPVKANLGETYSLHVPIEVEGTEHEYKFTFKVQKAILDFGGRLRGSSSSRQRAPSTVVIEQK